MQTQLNKTEEDSSLRIIPLGGQEEVGRNMTVFEYKNDIVILDMGLQFPEEDMPGIDYIIPNINYLKGKSKNIKAVVFTHGHMDHIGAAPILLEKLGYPLVIGLPLTIALIKNRMENHKKGSSKNLKSIQIKSINENIKLNNFQLRFFEVEHSIMDSMGVVFSTPVATAIHLGDWTLGTDSSKEPISYDFLSKTAKPSVLMIESLGATNKTPLSTEQDMWKNLRKILSEAPGRIIVATFSTQVKRVRDIINYAEKIGKKVAVDGFSMKTNIKIAQQLGYIKSGKGTLVDIKKIGEEPDNKVIIICTGAQGENRAVLSRIVTGNHRFVHLKKKDTIIFSSSVVPGNERTVQRLKDNLYRQCDNVIHNEIMNIHVSGHNNIEAIQKVVKQIQPTFVLPVYANHYLLKEAEKDIQAIGFPPKNIFILDNGHIIKFNKDKRPVIEAKKVDTSYVFIDGLGSDNFEAIVLRDRRALATDGIFVIIAAVDNQTGKIINSPDIISRGFVHLDASKLLLNQSRKKVVAVINKATGSGQSINWAYIKKNLRDELGDFFYQKTKKRPMILPVVIEV